MCRVSLKKRQTESWLKSQMLRGSKIQRSATGSVVQPS